MTAKVVKKYAIKTSSTTSRKYPNVIWFPRSKTDPREIREVLKLAQTTQHNNADGFFNDNLLGEHMAQIGSINVLGLDGDKYIKSYKGKSTGDVSYITNARMLIRLFRFLGFVTRIKKGRYVLTDLGTLYCQFSGDFPSYINGVSEDQVLLESLANFSFYSINDDPSYRDSKFKIRPFVWLLYNLSLEPQCIYQLIVTAFASQSENPKEIKRIKDLLFDLRNGATTLKKAWKKLGLDADNYSCVHNFYDSVKILIYLGVSLELIHKTSDATYGKKISGGGRHLKQASAFYELTSKGKSFLKKNLPRKVIFYEQLYSIFGDKNILEATVLLATLNFNIGKITVNKVRKEFFNKSLDIPLLITKFGKDFDIEIIQNNGYLALKEPVTFSYFQSVPPEFLQLEFVQKHYNNLMSEIENNDTVKISGDDHSQMSVGNEYSDRFELDVKRFYSPKSFDLEKLKNALQYKNKEDIFGGQDRFSSRVSPTNSVILEKKSLYVNNKTDALDLLVPLRLRDSDLGSFIEKNLLDLIKYFLKKSDTWEKDQHYTWVRNCFRQLGMEANYSGSGGMLSRADVSILSPFIGGVEAKSPRENRGTINTKAIRQAVDAKIQVASQYNTKIPRAAIASGRRITVQAINEEKKWAKEEQPILLLHDVVLYYLILKSAKIQYSQESLIKFFTENNGPITEKILLEFFVANIREKDILNKTTSEIKEISKYFETE